MRVSSGDSSKISVRMPSILNRLDSLANVAKSTYIAMRPANQQNTQTMPPPIVAMPMMIETVCVILNVCKHIKVSLTNAHYNTGDGHDETDATLKDNRSYSRHAGLDC